MGLIWLGLAWLAGLAIGYGRDLRPWWPVAAWLGLALVALASLMPRWRRPLCWAALALAAVSLATWRVALLPVPVADMPGGAIDAVRGQVVEWPARGDRSDTAIVAVEAVRIAGVWQEATATIRAEVPLSPAVGRGDRLELAGYYRPASAIDLASFRTWLERRGLHGQFSAFSTRVLATGERETAGVRHFALLGDLEERLRRHIPGAEGALATGILLGDDHLLPKATRDAFAATSTSHTMALSGWNVAVIAWVCATIGGWVRQSRSRLWLCGSALAIWIFVLFVGASPTLVRAAIMGTLYLLAEVVGRRGDALTALAVSAVGMTAVAPGTIFDIGFQLSCAATAGLILLAPSLTAWFGRLRLPALVATGAAATLAAEVATLPLIIYHFGRVSRVTLPANLLVELPVQGIMLGAFATGLASYLPGPLADFFGLLTWLPARLMLFVVEMLGALPWATQRLPTPNWALTLALYAVPLGARSTFPALRGLLVRRTRATTPAFGPFAVGLLGGLVISAWIALFLLR